MDGLGTIGAFIGSIISYKLNTNVLRKCFGIFLGIIAIHEIYNLVTSNKNKNNTHNKIEDKNERI